MLIPSLIISYAKSVYHLHIVGYFNLPNQVKFNQSNANQVNRLPVIQSIIRIYNLATDTISYQSGITGKMS